MAFEALKELQSLQELEQELDLELQQALELKQALELQYHAELEVDPHPKHDEKLLQPGLQQQGKSAVATSSRLPIRNEAQSQITRKRERDGDNAAGKQVTSMQNEETDDTKRQKKDSSSSSSSSSNSSSSSSHKPTTTATVTRPQPSNQTSTETAGVSALDGTIEKE
jgi:hypothetical protein